MINQILTSSIIRNIRRTVGRMCMLILGLEGIIHCSVQALNHQLTLQWRGTGGRETGRKGGGRCTGDGRRGGGKWDYKGGGKWEKKGKIMQHCAIFCNQKNAKRREPTSTGQEPGLKGTGSGRFKPPCPLPSLSNFPLKSPIVLFSLHLPFPPPTAAP